MMMVRDTHPTRQATSAATAGRNELRNRNRFTFRVALPEPEEPLKERLAPETISHGLHA